MIINKKIIKFFILLIFLFQLSLIAHRMSFNFAILINFYKKDFGDKESLKINYQFSKAIEINFLIKKYNINTFSLSENLINNISYSRIIEFNYPVKFKVNSLYLFSLKDEKINNCNLIDKNNSISLYKC